MIYLNLLLVSKLLELALSDRYKLFIIEFCFYFNLDNSLKPACKASVLQLLANLHQCSSDVLANSTVENILTIYKSARKSYFSGKSQIPKQPKFC
jgi:hypothetical protein